MPRIQKNMTTLRQAVEWIAEEDAAYDNDNAEVISGYLTVHLAAHLFGVSSLAVAKKVVIYRKQREASA